jgi:NTE family protein
MQVSLRKFKSSFSLILAFVFLFSVSCDHLDKRTKLRKAKGQTPKEEAVVPPIQEDDGDEKKVSIIEPVDDAPVVEVAKAPKLGLILGPGGLKTFAHIGILKEFEKAKIPVEAVVGIEWGSLIAAFYGLNAKANEAEWKLLKLKEKEIFNRGFLSSSSSPGKVHRLDNFIKRELGKKRHSEFRVKFSCPTYSINLRRVYWMTRGPVMQSLKHCMPYPPIFKPSGDRVAAVNAIEAAAKHLKSSGIDLVVFVDVLSQGRLMKKDKLLKSYQTGLLWINLQSYMKEMGKHVDEVITVNTKNYGIGNYSYRQVLVSAGARQGRRYAQKLLDKYGY